MSSELRSMEKNIQSTEVLEDASFWKRVSVAMCHKTIAYVDDGFGDRTPVCREDTHYRADSDSRIYAAIPGRTRIGPVIQFHIIQFVGTHGIEIQIPTTRTPNRTSRVVIRQGVNCNAAELHFSNHTSIELLLDRSVAVESEPCSTEMEQSRIEETYVTQYEIPTNPAY